jgi:hypothetical protein
VNSDERPLVLSGTARSIIFRPGYSATAAERSKGMLHVENGSSEVEAEYPISAVN